RPRVTDLPRIQQFDQRRTGDTQEIRSLPCGQLLVHWHHRHTPARREHLGHPSEDLTHGIRQLRLESASSQRQRTTILVQKIGQANQNGPLLRSRHHRFCGHHRPSLPLPTRQPSTTILESAKRNRLTPAARATLAGSYSASALALRCASRFISRPVLRRPT